MLGAVSHESLRIIKQYTRTLPASGGSTDFTELSSDPSTPDRSTCVVDITDLSAEALRAALRAKQGVKDVV